MRLRTLLLAAVSALLAGCPRPPPAVPPAEDSAALEAGLVAAERVTFRVQAYTPAGRPPPTHDLDVRVVLGPGDRVAVSATGQVGGRPVQVGDTRAAPRDRVVGRLLRDGALALVRPLAAGGAPDLSPTARRPVTASGQGWEFYGEDARGVRFREADTLATLWIGDASGRLLARTTRRADESPVAFESYSEWSVAPRVASSGGAR